MVRSTLGTVAAVAAAYAFTATIVLLASYESNADSPVAPAVQLTDVHTALLSDDAEDDTENDADLPAWAIEPDRADRQGARFVIAAVSSSADPQADLRQTAVAKLQDYAAKTLHLSPHTVARIDDQWASQLLQPGRQVTVAAADASGQSRILQEFIVPPQAVSQLQAWQTEQLRGHHNRVVAAGLLITAATSGVLFAVFRRIRRRSERYDIDR